MSGSASDDNKVYKSHVQVATDVIEATDTTGKDKKAVEVSELGREELILVEGVENSLEMAEELGKEEPGSANLLGTR